MLASPWGGGEGMKCSRAERWCRATPVAASQSRMIRRQSGAVRNFKSQGLQRCHPPPLSTDVPVCRQSITSGLKSRTRLKRRAQPMRRGLVIRPSPRLQWPGRCPPEAEPGREVRSPAWKSRHADALWCSQLVKSLVAPMSLLSVSRGVELISPPIQPAAESELVRIQTSEEMRKKKWPSHRKQ